MKCRVCDSEDLELVIDLGMQPWGNNFLKRRNRKRTILSFTCIIL